MSDDVESNVPPAGDGGDPIPLESIPLHSTNLLTVLDPSGIIKYESPSIERLYGYEQDALVGDQVADYFHPDDRDRVMQAFHRLTTSDEYTVETVEYRHEQADGTYTWVESVGAANPTPEGYYVINSRDISDRKAREQELESTNERLEQFADIVSHDLRNPLTVAQGHLELARDAAPSEHHDAVATALERMEGLIEDLLRLAKQGGTIEEFHTVDVAEIAEQSWQNVTTGDCELVTAIDRPIRADRFQMAQLLENLIRNAVEHGGETVTVGDLETDSGFYIEDDGPGIAESRREQVFQTGYSTADEGFGLGLSIVADIVAAHGWNITVTDGSDGGARFEITGVEFAN